MKKKLNPLIKRTEQQKKWLRRQLNDPYVENARKEGYRSRAAYKLIEINDKFKLFKPGQRILDLGAAPGSWCQVVQKKIGKKGELIAVDLLEITPIPGVTCIQGDFRDESILEKLSPSCHLTRSVILAKAGTHENPTAQMDPLFQGDDTVKNNLFDGVISDMAPSSTGFINVDQLKMAGLIEELLDYLPQLLKPEGFFLFKTFQGGLNNDIQQRLKKMFKTIKNVKPAASRSDSRETYVLCS